MQFYLIESVLHWLCFVVKSLVCVLGRLWDNSLGWVTSLSQRSLIEIVFVHRRPLVDRLDSLSWHSLCIVVSLRLFGTHTDVLWSEWLILDLIELSIQIVTMRSKLIRW